MPFPDSNYSLSYYVKVSVDKLSYLPLESAICVEGKVQLRPENMRNEVSNIHSPSALYIVTAMSAHEDWTC